MAVKTFNPFSTGYRLIDGTKLNNLFSGFQQMLKINVANGATIGGGLTVSGGSTVTGAQKAAATYVTPVGASRASAAAIPATAINVWCPATGSSKGLSLPAMASGQSLWIWPFPTNGVKVFTAAGYVINALASTGSLQLASAKPVQFYSADAVHIRTLPITA